jgi:hypothetical protein
MGVLFDETTTIAVRSRGEVCPMPCAGQCPMPHAQCPMPYADGQIVPHVTDKGYTSFTPYSRFLAYRRDDTLPNIN